MLQLINGIITKNVDNILIIIVVDIITIFFNVTNRFKCGAIIYIPIVTSDNCFERDRNLECVASNQHQHQQQLILASVLIAIYLNIDYKHHLLSFAFANIEKFKWLL